MIIKQRYDFTFLPEIEERKNCGNAEVNLICALKHEYGDDRIFAKRSESKKVYVNSNTLKGFVDTGSAFNLFAQPFRRIR